KDYAAFERSSLAAILDYVTDLPAEEIKTFIVRSAPDSFYVISTGSKNGAKEKKWQITFVQQSIIANNDDVRADFTNVMKKSGRGVRKDGTFGIKAPNDSDNLGHLVVDQLILLDNMFIFMNIEALMIVNGPLLTPEDISMALSRSSELINHSTGKLGFSVALNATVISSDDFQSKPDLKSINSDLEMLINARNAAKSYDFEDKSMSKVVLLSENRDENIWEEIVKENLI
ncbi:unnamed protein product, partial [marine sediment metagenome]